MGNERLAMKTGRVQVECTCCDASGNGFHNSHNIVDNFHTTSISFHPVGLRTAFGREHHFFQFNLLISPRKKRRHGKAHWKTWFEQDLLDCKTASPDGQLNWNELIESKCLRVAVRLWQQETEGKSIFCIHFRYSWQIKLIILNVCNINRCNIPPYLQFKICKWCSNCTYSS